MSDTLAHGGAGAGGGEIVGLKWCDLRNTICICTSKRRSRPAPPARRRRRRHHHRRRRRLREGNRIAMVRGESCALRRPRAPLSAGRGAGGCICGGVPQPSATAGCGSWASEHARRRSESSWCTGSRRSRRRGRAHASCTTRRSSAWASGWCSRPTSSSRCVLEALHVPSSPRRVDVRWRRGCGPRGCKAARPLGRDARRASPRVRVCRGVLTGCAGGGGAGAGRRARPFGRRQGCPSSPSRPLS